MRRQSPLVSSSQTSSPISSPLSKSSIFQQSCRSVLGSFPKQYSGTPPESPNGSPSSMSSTKQDSFSTHFKSSFFAASSSMMNPQTPQLQSTQASLQSSTPSQSPSGMHSHSSSIDNNKTNELLEWLRGNSSVAYEDIMAKQDSAIVESNSPASIKTTRRKRNADYRMKSWDSTQQLFDYSFEEVKEPPKPKKQEVNDFYKEFILAEEKSTSNQTNSRTPTKSRLLKHVNSMCVNELSGRLKSKSMPEQEREFSIESTEDLNEDDSQDLSHEARGRNNTSSNNTNGYRSILKCQSPFTRETEESQYKATSNIKKVKFAE